MIWFFYLPGALPPSTSNQHNPPCGKDELCLFSMIKYSLISFQGYKSMRFEIIIIIIFIDIVRIYLE